MIMTMDDNERRSELEPCGVRCDHRQTVEKCACRLSASTPQRPLRVQVQCVNVVIGVLLVHIVLLVIRVVPVLHVML